MALADRWYRVQQSTCKQRTRKLKGLKNRGTTGPKKSATTGPKKWPQDQQEPDRDGVRRLSLIPSRATALGDVLHVQARYFVPLKTSGLSPASV
jgi:hypothetical protein